MCPVYIEVPVPAYARGVLARWQRGPFFRTDVPCIYYFGGTNKTVAPHGMTGYTVCVERVLRRHE